MRWFKTVCVCMLIVFGGSFVAIGLTEILIALSENVGPVVALISYLFFVSVALGTVLWGINHESDDED